MTVKQHTKDRSVDSRSMLDFTLWMAPMVPQLQVVRRLSIEIPEIHWAPHLCARWHGMERCPSCWLPSRALVSRRVVCGWLVVPQNGPSTDGPWSSTDGRGGSSGRLLADGPRSPACGWPEVVCGWPEAVCGWPEVVCGWPGVVRGWRLAVPEGQRRKVGAIGVSAGRG